MQTAESIAADLRRLLGGEQGTAPYGGLLVIAGQGEVTVWNGVQLAFRGASLDAAARWLALSR